MQYDLATKLPPLIIKSHHPDSSKVIKLEVPIINGGMGVGVTGPKLASSVTNAGGGGLLTGVVLGYPFQELLGLLKDKKPFQANILALAAWINEAKKLTSGEFVGVNIMVATHDFKDMAYTAAKNGVDLIVAGAGLPMALPDIVNKFPDTMIAPIISSLKAARVVVKRWLSRNRPPDAIVFESILHSGGHQGGSVEDIRNGLHRPEETIGEIRDFIDKAGLKDVPLIWAGGIWDKLDILKALTHGAQGVQMASRFLLTEEAGFEFGGISAFKKIFIENQDETILLRSPAGLPGRGVATNFSQRFAYSNENLKHEEHKCPFSCLKSCDKQASIYCILDHLTDSLRDNVERGLFFAGTNIGNPAIAGDKKVVPVKELMQKLRFG
ncbi:MAG: NAD(P)H-dependent flavin oxidoreductase [Nitrospinota bacterium]